MMVAELLRRIVYATLLIMMGVTLWVSAWASQLERRVQRGWLEPLPPLHSHPEQN